MNLDQLQKEVMSLTDLDHWSNVPKTRDLLLQRITLLLEIEKVRALRQIQKSIQFPRTAK